jgi:hypothetical protein
VSMQALNWARKQRTGSPTRKAVLFALADQANADGECWPGQNSIAYDLELGRWQLGQKPREPGSREDDPGERTVRKAIQELERAGFLEVEERRWEDTQKRRTNRYRLNMGRGE